MKAVMKPGDDGSDRLRVGLTDPEPIRLEGFLTLFKDHSRIEFAPMSRAELLADPDLRLALVGIGQNERIRDRLSAIRGLRPNLILLAMGSESGDEAILAALAAGAKAYLHASATAKQVEQAIEIVSQGSVWAPRRVLSIFLDRVTRPAQRTCAGPEPVFTPREIQVLALLVKAKSNREIAAALGIEERTVKAHIAKMMRKVGVENRIALSARAVTHSISRKSPD